MFCSLIARIVVLYCSVVVYTDLVFRYIRILCFFIRRCIVSDANIQYITDSSGRKNAVVLPIEMYDELIEDLHDLGVIAERRDEACIPFDKLKESLG